MTTDMQEGVGERGPAPNGLTQPYLFVSVPYNHTVGRMHVEVCKLVGLAELIG